MPNLEEAINASKVLIDYGEKSEQSFSTYSKCYLYTTECISGYLKDLEFNKNRALTVLSSGDHIFNLIYKDIEHIDAFDINELTFYNFWLKRACITRLSFNEFKNFNRDDWFIYSWDKFYHLLQDLKNDMPKDVYTYYQTLLTYQANKNDYTGLQDLYKEAWIYNPADNLYANDEDAYEKVRSKINKVSLNFSFGNALDIPSTLEGGYDIILLSNISDYLGEYIPFGIDEFKNYIHSYYELLNQNGLIINYLYSLISHFVIHRSNITLEQLEKENVKKINKSEGYYLVRKI